VRCLEQLFLHLLTLDANDFDSIVAAVCAEPEVDRAITICFACNSGGAAGPNDVATGLESYIRDLRTSAPGMLCD
jgi:hypothetical protein